MKTTNGKSKSTASGKSSRQASPPRATSATGSRRNSDPTTGTERRSSLTRSANLSAATKSGGRQSLNKSSGARAAGNTERRSSSASGGAKSTNRTSRAAQSSTQRPGRTNLSSRETHDENRPRKANTARNREAIQQDDTYDYDGLQRSHSAQTPSRDIQHTGSVGVRANDALDYDEYEDSEQARNEPNNSAYRNERAGYSASQNRLNSGDARTYRGNDQSSGNYSSRYSSTRGNGNSESASEQRSNSRRSNERSFNNQSGNDRNDGDGRNSQRGSNTQSERSSGRSNQQSSYSGDYGQKIERSSLMELFENELKDIYWAEKALVKALPKLAKNSQSEELIEALESHLEETEHHVERLQRVFEIIGKKAVAKRCEGMSGLIAEGNELIHGNERGPQRDAAIISAAQKAEHYEIASYGTLRTFAELLGLTDVAELLDETLQEEKNADHALTELAISSINIEALVDY